MKAGFKKSYLGAAAVIALMIMGGAHNVSAQGLVFESRQDFENAVKTYLLENPEVIFEETLQSFRQQEEERRQEAAAQGIENNIAYLTSKDAPSIGKDDAALQIVEFFDYNCGYCKRALTAIQEIVKENDNVRVVFRDMAILGPTSRTAALWAFAAHRQDKYFEYHTALMNHNGPKEEAELIKLAEGLDLDIEKMKQDANSEAAVNHIAKDMEVAREIGVQGTPAFVIGTEFVPGYIDADQMQKIIDEQLEKDAEE